MEEQHQNPDLDDDVKTKGEFPSGRRCLGVALGVVAVQSGGNSKIFWQQ
jgi:hypothetical protein